MIQFTKAKICNTYKKKPLSLPRGNKRGKRNNKVN